MYYNLKIYVKDSEFSLNSEDKAIVQREMDLYFARIFGASKEFSASIKDVVINNPNVKSISDFTSLRPSNPMSYSAPSQPARTIQTTQTIQQTVPQYTPQIEAPKEPPMAEYQKLLNKPSNHDVFSSFSNFFAASEADFKPSPSSPNYDSPQDVSSPVRSYEAMLKEAQKVIDSENKKTFEDKIPPVETSEEVFKSEVEPEIPTLEQKPYNVPSIAQYQEIVRQSQIAPADEKPYENVQNSVFTIDEAQKPQQHEDINEVLGIIFEQDTPKPEVSIYKQPEENPLDKIISQAEISQNMVSDFTSNYETLSNSLPQNSLPNEAFFESASAPAPSVYEQYTAAANISTQEEFEKKHPPDIPVTFSTFLDGFNVNELDKEFLICAFYIKNIAKLPSFTMKSINSKLFQATGRIADMSVVDELIKAYYIRTVSADDLITHYAITDFGEEFVVVNLQNK